MTRKNLHPSSVKDATTLFDKGHVWLVRISYKDIEDGVLADNMLIMVGKVVYVKEDGVILAEVKMNSPMRLMQSKITCIIPHILNYEG